MITLASCPDTSGPNLTHLFPVSVYDCFMLKEKARVNTRAYAVYFILYVPLLARTHVAPSDFRSVQNRLSQLLARAHVAPPDLAPSKTSCRCF